MKSTANHSPAARCWHRGFAVCLAGLHVYCLCVTLAGWLEQAYVWGREGQHLPLEGGWSSRSTRKTTALLRAGSTGGSALQDYMLCALLVCRPGGLACEGVWMRGVREDSALPAEGRIPHQQLPTGDTGKARVYGCLES